MVSKDGLYKVEQLDELIRPMLRLARVPGAALAVVTDSETVFARGYGYRDLEAKLPLTSDTVYPIASTSKALNATLLGMLVDEGRLAWDTPVQHYLPSFRLIDPVVSAQVTMRDLLTMRTGLPRHDWLWLENPMSRAELVQRLRHLELSAGLRERFQYNNMTATTAGHVAEVVTGQCWEDLLRERILEPLGLRSTGFALPSNGNVTASYHENIDRELLVSQRFACEVTAPSGGSIHSTVEDMARWMTFNLNGGKVGLRTLIQPQTLAEIHTPQMVVGKDPSPPTPEATYAMGWFVDTYNGCPRLSHGGYLHDVNTEVMVFPRERLGIVSFINFGLPAIARLINQQTFDLLMGFRSALSVEEKLAQYEKRVEETRQRNASAHRIKNTFPSHALNDYVGVYEHAGYGRIEFERNGEELTFKRNHLMLPLIHWHYNVWVAQAIDLFPIHVPHTFDLSGRFLFETDVEGAIVAVSLPFEPAVRPIRFEKRKPMSG